jgi:hypothetical protein
MLAQARAQFQDPLLLSRIQAIPSNRATRGTVSEIDSIQPSAVCSPHPKGNLANTYTKFSCYRSHTLSSSHPAYHLSALLFRRTFLFMNIQSKKPKTYFNCSTIAEPQVFNEC